jgi:hypothetical protein
MTTFGKNMRITVAKNHRALLRQMFTEALGCALKTPKDDLDVYAFPDGFGLGAYFVDASEALTQADHRKAPWLEIFVDDPEKATSALRALGIEPFEYVDKAHSYFCPPSGPVFRLAKQP